MGFVMIAGDKTVVHIEYGLSRDIETIVKLRPWIEDEVRLRHGDFTSTKLYTDYKQETETFEFKIVFIK